MPLPRQPLADPPRSLRDTQTPVSSSSQLYLVPRGGQLVVGAGDHHRCRLCLPGVSDCAGHHLLQSHKEVSVQPQRPGGGPSGSPARLGRLQLSDHHCK